MINDQSLSISSNESCATLFSKLAAIMEEMPAITKDGENKFHKYSYASASNVANEIRILLGKHKVAFLPEVVETKNVDGRWLVVYRYTFACGETGATYSCRWEGEAQSMTGKGAIDDKSLAKAATTAQKYFLLKTFNVSTDDDLDNDSVKNRKVQPQRKQQQPKEWANKSTVAGIMDHFRKHDLSDSETFAFAGVTAFNDPDWNKKYKSYSDAIASIQDAWNKELAATPPATPKSSNDPADDIPF